MDKKEIIDIKEKMIDLMAEHLTSPINDKKSVIEYFKKEAQKCLKMKKK